MMVVSISSEDYDSYADVASADLYLNASSHADDWRAVSDQDTKGRYLVTATRLLDRQTWLDAYNTQALREDVEGIQEATIELALALLEGSDVQDNSNTAERFRSITAGSVSITNSWRAFVDASRFPQIVQELLRPYLIGDSSGTLGGKATGVDEQSINPVDLGFNGGM